MFLRTAVLKICGLLIKCRGMFASKNVVCRQKQIGSLDYETKIEFSDDTKSHL